MLIVVSVFILYPTVNKMAKKMWYVLCFLAMMTAAMSHASYHCCPTSTTTLKEACNTFTSNMFTEVTSDNNGDSCVQSAFSVLFPLGQLALGSVGQSHDDILRAMAMPSDNAIKQEFAAYTQQTGPFKENNIHLASRVYIRVGYALTKNFKRETSDFFGTVQTLDFAKKSDTAKKINKYVEDNTNKRIRDIIDATDITLDTVTIIVNAAEYKGFWVHEFHGNKTHECPFYVSPHLNTTVKMMRQINTFKYGESSVLDAKILELPYKNSDVRFIAVLPNQNNGINLLINKVKDPVKLSQGLELMKDFIVSVGLPRFKIETKTNLKQVLSRMGVERLFTRGEAHLDKMIVGENDLYVSTAIQKTFIEVNEEGSREETGSRFVVKSSALSLDASKSFIANHPFLFFLLDKNDMILFNGVFRH